MQSEFDRASGRLTFRCEDVPSMQIIGAIAWVRYRLESGAVHQAALAGSVRHYQMEAISDIHGEGAQEIFNSLLNQDGIESTYVIKRYQQQSFLQLQLTVRNAGHEPVYLDSLCLFQVSPSLGGQVRISTQTRGLRFLQIGWHGWAETSLRLPGDRHAHSWVDRLASQSYSNLATPTVNLSGEFWSEGWGILAGDDGAFVAGFTSTARQFGQVYSCLRPGEEAMMLVTQVDGIRLDPGEEIASEWGYIQFVPLPNPDPGAEFIDAVALQMHARVPQFPPPPMWTHWYQYYQNINEALFVSNLKVLANKKGIVPYQVVELDDGFQSAWGDWTQTNTSFPHGLEWLAGEITSRGFTPGLWLAPFAVQRKSHLARQHPRWLVKDGHGRPAIIGFVNNIFFYSLDLTYPPVLEYLRQLADQLCNQWKYGLLKLDFLNCAALPGKRYDPKLTRAEALRHGLEALRQGAGEHTFLLGCGCPFGPAIGVMDAMRIGPDTAASWEPHFHFIPWAGPLIKTNPSMPALRNALRNTLVLSSLHRKWWWNDPDCLLVRDKSSRLTKAEVMSAASLVGLSGGMVISSDDLNAVSDANLRLISLLVPNLGLNGLALDLFEHRMPNLYQVKVEHANTTWQLVAVFNWSDTPCDYHLRFSELGFAPGSSLHVFDFWDGHYSRVSEGEMSIERLPPHGCKLLRACEVGTIPLLVGDTLHISQGVEIKSMRIADDVLKIETIDMGRFVSGEIYLALGASPKEASCNGEVVLIEGKGKGVHAVRVEFWGKATIAINL